MSTNRCKACGGEMELDKTAGIAVCQYCGSQQPLSAEDIVYLNNVRSAESAQNKSYNKTGKKRKGMILILIIILAFVIYYTNSNHISIADAHMTTALDSNNQSIDSVRIYDANADKFIFLATVKGIKENINVTVIWKYIDTVIYTSDKFELTQEKNHVYSYITPAAKPWTTGLYHVELYIDSETRPIETVYFSVN